MVKENIIVSAMDTMAKTLSAFFRKEFEKRDFSLWEFENSKWHNKHKDTMIGYGAFEVSDLIKAGTIHFVLGSEKWQSILVIISPSDQRAEDRIIWEVKLLFAWAEHITHVLTSTTAPFDPVLLENPTVLDLLRDFLDNDEFGKERKEIKKFNTLITEVLV
jgi:hypothetical protein